MELSEQINSRIKEAVEAVKKASETNEELRLDLQENKNRVQVNFDLQGNVVGIGIPVKVRPRTEAGTEEDDRPMSTF